MQQDKELQVTNRKHHGLDFSNGLYRTTLGKVIIVHKWLPKLQLWYGLWIKEQKVVYFDEWGLCNDDRVGKLDRRQRGGERL